MEPLTRNYELAAEKLMQKLRDLNKPVIFFGANNISEYMLAYKDIASKVLFIIDSYKEGSWKGKEIKKPEAIRMAEDAFICINSVDHVEAMCQCIKEVEAEGLQRCIRFAEIANNTSFFSAEPSPLASGAWETEVGESTTYKNYGSAYAKVEHVSVVGNLLIVIGWTKEAITELYIGENTRNFAMDAYWYPREGLNTFFKLSPKVNSGFIFVTTMTDLFASKPKKLTVRLENDTKQVSEELGWSDVDLLKPYQQRLHEAINVYGEKTPLRGALDQCWVIPGHGICCVGWLLSVEAPIVSLTLLKQNHSEKTLPRGYWFSRHDLQQMHPEQYSKAGLVAYFPMPGVLARKEESDLETVLLAQDAAGNCRFFITKPVTVKGESWDFTKHIVPFLNVSDPDLRYLLDEHIGPALKDYGKICPPRHCESQVQQYLQPVESPEVSIVVPIYGQVDFVNFQLSQFANDADFQKKVDLIYVLDDPDKKSWFWRYCHSMAPIYQVPFRVITYEENLGYSGANNVGISFAKGGKIILMNSDVIPKEPGWVSTLLAEYANCPEVGALGVKLLYPDGSLQHGGMEFRRRMDIGEMWFNIHPRKGLPDGAEQQVTFDVPAVTGACLLIDKQLYHEVGGLEESYLRGDFEDSDLCLKLTARNKLNYYTNKTSLYHLERQSFRSSEEWKEKLTLYNCWQHTRRWDGTITKLMERYQ